ncbi:hypothetical protein MKW98_003113 [Papaver atlanticum]|uniref:Uncharacterized protein n=1 Tax=Papaver atlanticum TaxID=357466 RepID=A0AAD4XXV1_9MAGN|nr:hypothetical protein MKW98_003113 [Papaver atlanticum]
MILRFTTEEWNDYYAKHKHLIEEQQEPEAQQANLNQSATSNSAVNECMVIESQSFVVGSSDGPQHSQARAQKRNKRSRNDTTSVLSHSSQTTTALREIPNTNSIHQNHTLLLENLLFARSGDDSRIEDVDSLLNSTDIDMDAMEGIGVESTTENRATKVQLVAANQIHHQYFVIIICHQYLSVKERTVQNHRQKKILPPPPMMTLSKKRNL